LYVMHRVAQRRAARMVRKHGFWPVPSCSLREARSPNLVEGVFSEVLADVLSWKYSASASEKIGM
jgi:hypothetical protein